ncbi:MAG: hypothetical protein HKM06_07695 [Spirochaetales bacterium]|nr:hypothetical protein [Spirochaetales bacterium]
MKKRLFGWSFVVLGVAALFYLLDHITINSTPSLPEGIYWKTDTAPKVGDIVIVPKTALEDRFQYPFIPPFLLKTIAAEAPSKIDDSSAGVYINGKYLGPRPDFRYKYPTLILYSFHGQLSPGEAWLMNPPADSFDSRHFGPVSLSDLSKKVVPLWTF